MKRSRISSRRCVYRAIARRIAWSSASWTFPADEVVEQHRAGHVADRRQLAPQDRFEPIRELRRDGAQVIGDGIAHDPG